MDRHGRVADRYYLAASLRSASCLFSIVFTMALLVHALCALPLKAVHEGGHLAYHEWVQPQTVPKPLHYTLQWLSIKRSHTLAPPAWLPFDKEWMVPVLKGWWWL